MILKKDIQTRDDIFLIIDQFYRQILADASINLFFHHIVSSGTLERHLNTITDFWNGILFDATDYQRNAMQPHLDLNKTIPFKNNHFKTWLQHFTKTIDSYYIGENAEKMKARAISIATVMEIKMIDAGKTI